MAYSWDLTFQTTGTPDGASLRNRDGTAYASQPTFTLVDQGGGFWTCYTDGMPDAHRGAVRVLQGATVLTIGLVSPQEMEYPDVKTSAVKTVTDQLAAAQAEPTSVPAANATPLEKLAYIFTRLRNRRTQDADTETLYQDDGSTVLATASKSDDGDTFTKGADTTA